MFEIQADTMFIAKNSEIFRFTKNFRETIRVQGQDTKIIDISEKSLKNLYKFKNGYLPLHVFRFFLWIVFYILPDGSQNKSIYRIINVFIYSNSIQRVTIIFWIKILNKNFQNFYSKKRLSPTSLNLKFSPLIVMHD